MEGKDCIFHASLPLSVRQPEEPYPYGLSSSGKDLNIKSGTVNWKVRKSKVKKFSV